MAKSATGAKKSAKKTAKEKKPRKKRASSSGTKGISKKAQKQSGGRIAEKKAIDLEAIAPTYAEEAWSDQLDQIAVDLSEGNFSPRPAYLFGIKSKSGMVALLLGVALTTFALTAYWAGIRPSFWSQEGAANRTLAAVNPADFWQQRPQIVMKGDYNGEVTMPDELKPIVDRIADSDPEATPAGVIIQGDNYPAIEAGVLPYGTKTEVIEGGIDITAIDAENMTTIGKTPPAEPVDQAIKLAEGESLFRRLVGLGVTPEATRSLVAAIELVSPGQLMKPGMTFDVTLDKQQDFYGNNVIFPVRLSFEPRLFEQVIVEADENGQFNARVVGEWGGEPLPFD